MSSRVIREWLSEYKALPEAELNTYANTIRNNDELINAIYDLLEEDLSQEIVDPVCHQLFEFYRSSHRELQRFTLEFVPTLIWVYLSAVSKNEKRKCGGVEVCLLGIYNLDTINKDGSPKVQQLTIPTLAVPSIYHEPPSLATLALTETALLRYHSDEPVVISSGTLLQVENINAQNRLSILTHVLNSYNMDIANLSGRSHHALCKMCCKLVKTGFDNLGSCDLNCVSHNESGSSSASRNSRGVKFFDEPRIVLSSGLLVELLNGIYFVMFNGQAELGTQALGDVHNRASYELYTDVLMVTNAVRNSLMFNPSGQPQDGPIGISVALSPTATNPSFSKNAITNASFRAKKLPEDIEVPDEEDEPPRYEEIVDQDQTKTDTEKSKSGKKLGLPLKSIMKKDKNKVQRKESDLKKKDKENDDSHSPRNSMVGTPGGGGSMNGDVLDVSQVNVSVVRSSSRVTVDQIDLKNTSVKDSHRRTSSYPEDGSVGNQSLDGEARPILQPASHMREFRSALNGESRESSSGSLNTKL